jgi:gamma-glutamylaminecyclotransferase
MRKQFLVAVYGTLKTGKGNNSLMALIKAKLVGTGKTVEKYSLIVCGGLPYLFENAGVGHQVEVEIYSVDSQALKILDTFEGHPNFYIRKSIKCELSNGETRVCFIYFINRKRADFSEFILLKNY